MTSPFSRRDDEERPSLELEEKATFAPSSPSSAVEDDSDVFLDDNDVFLDDSDVFLDDSDVTDSRGVNNESFRISENVSPFDVVVVPSQCIDDGVVVSPIRSKDDDDDACPDDIPSRGFYALDKDRDIPSRIPCLADGISGEDEARLKELFSKLDRNDDGQICIEDLAKSFRELRCVGYGRIEAFSCFCCCCSCCCYFCCCCLSL